MVGFCTYPTFKINLNLHSTSKNKLQIFSDIDSDYSKAFDQINHKLVIAKLKYFGFKEIPLNFFSSYLTDRTQFVSVNKRQSSSELILSGVPQGSVLGSLLSVLYTADLPSHVIYSCLQSFADDNQIIHYFDLYNVKIRP